MNILLLGSGGREHALAWKISKSVECRKLFIAPGNGGTRLHGTNIAMKPSDFHSVGRFVQEQNIGLVVVGPEDPLVSGIHDYFLADPILRQVPVIGPVQAAARLEGSKDFSKAFMMRHRIPTAAYNTFTSGEYKEACSFLESLRPPYVLKADGLAAGKGVIIVDHYTEACNELQAMLGGKFGAASEKVVIEEFLKGTELSVFVYTQCGQYCLLPVAKDYKRAGNADSGPNTGGMGSVSGVPFAGQDFMEKVDRLIIRPTVAGLQQEGIPYTGFIFFGLIRVGDQPFVIEYNARMGDPETESVMPRLKSDILEMFDHGRAGTLHAYKAEEDERFVASVMLVSGGYPGSYQKDKEIFLPPADDDQMIFHAGTRFEENSGKYFTDGGRVLTASAYGESLQKALSRAYELAGVIRFENAFYRADIGWDLLNY